MALYWLIQALGHVLLNRHFLVSSLRKTESIFIDKVPFTLLPWVRLKYTNTNAKEQQICPSVSMQKRAFKLVLCPPEWKKVEFFSVFALLENTLGKVRGT